MAFKLLAIAASLPLSYAFRDSAPLLLWSSSGAPFLDSFKAVPQEDFSTLSSILVPEAICSYDSVVFIDQPGIYASDLRSLSSSSALSMALRDAKSLYQTPYTQSLSRSALASTADELAARCGAYFTVVSSDIGEIAGSSKQVIYVSFPELPDEPQWRKLQLVEQDSSLSRIFSYPSTNSLFIFTGSSRVPLMENIYKRQIANSMGADIPLPFGFAPSNGTNNSTAGGILAHYQLLTPGLILTLLATFFVMLPIVILGVNALSSIQSSVRLDAPKGPGFDKKNQ